MSEQDAALRERVKYSEKLKKVLHLESSLVACALLREPPEGVQPWQGEHPTRICALIEGASQGNTCYCVAEDIACGGKFFTGLSVPPPAEFAHEIYLSDAKKLFCSRATANIHQKQAFERIPFRMGKYAAFAPLEKATFEPQVVIFIVLPLQAMRLAFLEAFDTGIFNVSYIEPMCSGLIAIPLSSGQIGISFIDPGARIDSGFSPAVMGMGVPYETLHRIVKAIPYAHMGIATPDNEALSRVPIRGETLKRLEYLDKDLSKYFSLF